MLTRAERYMVKLAYPDIDLDKVKVHLADQRATSVYRWPRKNVTLNWFVFQSAALISRREHTAKISIGYDDELDILIVRQNSFSSIHRYPGEPGYMSYATGRISYAIREMK